MIKKQILIFAVILCGATSAFAQATKPAETDYKDFVIKQVAAIHGGNGPFAVAGYRMGARALEELKLLKGSFEVDVTHESLPEVGWTCIADGIQSSTGASVGKMNLRVAPVKESKAVRSIVTHKQTGTKITFRLTDSFLEKYGKIPYAELDQAGRTVMDLKDEEIFGIEIVKGANEKSSPFEQRKNAATKKPKK